MNTDPENEFLRKDRTDEYFMKFVESDRNEIVTQAIAGLTIDPTTEIDDL